jgi:hypothetical protein
MMSDTAMVPAKSGGDPSACRPVVDGEQADQLRGKAQAEGVELLGPDGLLSQVTKAVLERVLVEEVTGGPGYEKHDPPGKATTIAVVARPKTVLTHIGTVDLACPATATAPSNAFSKAANAVSWSGRRTGRQESWFEIL